MAATIISGPAHGSDNPRFRRWGVGWDNGLAVRYMLNPSWGLGVRVDAKIWYRIGNSSQWQHDNELRIDYLLFNQRPLAHGLSIGPFAEVQTSIGRAGFEGATDRIGLAIGLRPALSVRDRFVLETRFGLESSYSREINHIGTTIDDERDLKEYSRHWDYTWDLHSIDDDVRLISRLRFILMF